MSGLTDEKIIECVIGGNTEIFEELYNRYKAIIYNVCYRYTRNEQEAKDLTQDVFIKAFKSIASFKGKSSFSVWLYKIAVNHSKNRFRRNKIAKFFSFEKVQNEGSDEEVIMNDPIDPHTDVEKNVERIYALDTIQEVLLSLEPELREAIQLRFVENRSYDEIAKLCNCPAGTVGSRLSRAHIELRKKLKKIIGDYNGL